MNATSRRATKLIRLTSATLAIALIAAGCGSSNDGKSGKSTPGDGSATITVAEQSVAGMTTGLWPHLAEQLGYFKDEGITIKKYISVTKGSDAINGMESGDVQVSHIGVDGITAASKGAKVVGLSAAMDASIWTVVASPDVKNWSDLKGKTIALGSLSDITRVIFGRLAKEAGLNPKTDLKFVALGATPQRIAAVQHGQASATLATYPPVYSVIKSGKLNDLGFAPPAKPVPHLMTTDIEASKSWARKNPKIVTKYLKAIIRAVEFVRDPANEKQAVAAIGKLESDPPDAIRAGLKKYFYDPATKNAYFPKNFRHDPEVFKDTVAAYKKLGLISQSITQNAYMDYSYLDAALKSAAR